MLEKTLKRMYAECKDENEVAELMDKLEDTLIKLVDDYALLRIDELAGANEMEV